MKRFFLSVALFFFGAGTASADYILIKIDLNQWGAVPAGGAGVVGGQEGNAGAVGQVGGGPQPPFPGGAGFGGFAGIAGQPPPADPNQPNPPPGTPGVMPDDPNAKWVSAIVELKNRPKGPYQTPFGLIYTYDHKWSTVKSNYLPYSLLYPWVSLPVEAKTFASEFSTEFAKEKNAAKINKDKLAKNKIADNFLHLARWTLSRGQLKEFHKVMEEAEKIDDTHPVVKKYLRVKKALALPFKNEDPAQRDFIKELVQGGFKENVSKKGHYSIYAQAVGNDRLTDALIARRLALMEDTLESFYYWFALQKDASTSINLPKYRLNALLAGSDGEFKTRHLQWGSLPMVGDGFTPRRDNLIVLSAKVRSNDPIYHEFETMLTNKLLEINVKLEPFKIALTREDLLSGKINEHKSAGQVAIWIAAAQTAVVLSKTLEEEAERHTVTHEAVRQLLIASEMFPRNVQLPDWMIEGLAALLETPTGAVYPTIGAPSWTHLISFKHLRKTKKLAESEEVLRNVVTDSYFQHARQLAKEAQEQPGNSELHRANKEAWEIARSSAWAFTYYLAQRGMLDYLFNYGKQLDKLPRDMDLNYDVLQICFAKGFDMIDSKDARRIDTIKMQSTAGNWFAMMNGVNLDPPGIRLHYEQQRAKQDAPPPGDVPIANPNLVPNPNPGVNPNPNPNPPPANPKGGLAGSTWSGSETLAGYGALSFRFLAGGQATMIDKDGNTQGQWNQNGDSVTLMFPGGVTYTGTIAGNKLEGNATNGKDNWTWTLTRAGGGAPNPGGVNLNPPGGVRPPPGGVRPPGQPPRR